MGEGKGHLKVLFLCTGNACRSQMAEGWARALKGDRLEAFSAGVAPCYVHPLARKVMAEAGVDISGQYSKHVDDLAGISFDYVVTLCDYAAVRCPVVPGEGKRRHKPFEDPIEAFSAGVAPCYVHPLARKVMAEAGVDLSGQYSKHVEDLAGIDFDVVVTLCDYAAERCPAVPGEGKRLHRPFEDPIHAQGTEAEVLAKFRSVRNRIRKFVEGMPENLEG